MKRKLQGRLEICGKPTVALIIQHLNSISIQWNLMSIQWNSMSIQWNSISIQWNSVSIQFQFDNEIPSQLNDDDDDDDDDDDELYSCVDVFSWR